jgi:simple sugar transport system substrate-binding protein
MQHSDLVEDALERLDWKDAKAERSGLDRRAFLRRTALSGVAAGSVASLLSACGSSASSSSGSSSVFGSHPKYKFTVVNHVTTNTFFVPTQYALADACDLLGCEYVWTGSESSNVNQMVNAVNTAIASGVDGIAVSLIDLHAFNAPVETALKGGIPVISYNADAPDNKRLAYVGQDLKLAGEKMGERIVEDVKEGEVALFIDTPGSANLQPRIEGAEAAIKASGKPIKVNAVATGTNEPGQLSIIEAYWLSHKDTKGMYSVAGDSTAQLGKVMQKFGLVGKVKAGGFDLAEVTQKLLHEGYLEFTIDQQPYLQGFLPILQLFLWRVSGSLTGPAEVDTGLKFLDKESIAPYVESKSRFEGTSSSRAVVPLKAGAAA